MFIQELVELLRKRILLLMFDPVEGPCAVFFNTMQSLLINIQMKVLEKLPQLCGWILFKLLKMVDDYQDS